MVNRKLINIRLDQDLWHKVKVKAAEKGITLMQYVEEVLGKSIEVKK